MGGTTTTEYLYVGGRLNEPIGEQHLAEIAFYQRVESAPITGVGVLLPQGGPAVHFGLHANERQFSQLVQLVASKSLAEVYLAMDQPKRGHARVEAWSASSRPEEEDGE